MTFTKRVAVTAIQSARNHRVIRSTQAGWSYQQRYFLQRDTRPEGFVDLAQRAHALLVTQADFSRGNWVWKSYAQRNGHDGVAELARRVEGVLGTTRAQNDMGSSGHVRFDNVIDSTAGTCDAAQQRRLTESVRIYGISRH